MGVVLHRHELFLQLVVKSLVNVYRNVVKQNSVNSAQELPSISVVSDRRCQVKLLVILTDGGFGQIIFLESTKQSKLARMNTKDKHTITHHIIVLYN